MRNNYNISVFFTKSCECAIYNNDTPLTPKVTPSFLIFPKFYWTVNVFIDTKYGYGNKDLYLKI